MFEQLARGQLGKVVKDIAERKAVLFGKGNVDAIICGCRLQFEVEAAAEALAQRQAPCLVQAATEGCVQDELLAAAFVEKAFGNDGLLGRHGAKHAAPGDDVGDELQRSGITDEALAFEPGDAVAHLRMKRTGCEQVRSLRAGEVQVNRRRLHTACLAIDLRTQITNAITERLGSLRGFPFPEGDARRCAMRILNQYLALGVDALDAPACVAEQNDVAGM